MANATTERAGTAESDADDISLSLLEMMAVIGGEFHGVTFKAPRVPTFEVGS